MSGLALRLRAATKDIHATAEGTPVMASLIRGDIDRATYRRLLLNLQPIYAALEAETARHRRHPALAPLLQDGLARAAALASDLRDVGTAALAPSALTAAATAYAARLHALGDTQPALLAAHCYVRYLGDLNGGQMLARIVSTQLGAPTAFYAFGGPDEVRQRVAAFRDGLDGLPVSPAEADAIVAEAQAAFQRHVELFAELAA